MLHVLALQKYFKDALNGRIKPENWDIYSHFPACL